MTATATAARTAASIKKGDVLTNKAGKAYQVYSKKAQVMGWTDAEGLVAHAAWVFDVAYPTSRFELFFNDGSLAKGAANGGYDVA